MLFVVGLGNPGPQYAGHRHNVGFMAVDELARRHGFSPWRRKFQGELAEGTLGGEKALLLKPQTFMNESGRAVGEALRFYKLAPAALVVMHDDLDLPPGKVRIKTGGGHGGHNGLRSIDAAIGKDYRRLRIGIGHPGDKSRVTAHVLHDFAKSDQAWLDPLLDAIAEHAPLLAQGEDATFANRLHVACASTEPAGAKGARPSHSAAGRDASSPDHRENPLAAGLRKLFGKS